MTSREKFEVWLRAQPHVLNVGVESDGTYTLHEDRVAWEAWQASREAVEVELPEPHAHLIWVQAGNAPDDYWDDVKISRSEQDKCCDGSERYPVYARHEVVSMLDYAGIKVKGE
ncbi:hypothetical protein [Hafnia alvei]|uniref:hypothetical protein n=1 Tax=Hafnia alvei TaxID=569 RepID=UPI001D10A95E|nr:hypothetical protein [Hafnia alvei]